MIYLFVWAVLAGQPYIVHFGWYNLGGFDSIEACNSAASELAVKKHLCIYKETGKAM